MANTKSLVHTGTKKLGSNEEAGGNYPLLSADYRFEGNNGTYVLLADQRIGSGGESQVYLAKRESDDAMFAAKIYNKFQDNPENRNLRQSIIEFLEANADYTVSHLMPLFDHGTVTLPSDDGSDYRYPIDILPVCKDGSIKAADYATLREMVIPQLLSALHLMHSAGFVHRDLKPDNLYVYNDQIVLGDFGTVSVIADSTVQFHSTTQRRGTEGYTAPEVWQGYAVFKSDYFSLGCTIATLYNGGEHVYKRLLDANDSSALNRFMNTDGLKLNCPDDERDIEVLVNALAVMEEKERADYEAVQLWLQNPATFVKKYKRTRKAAPEVEFRYSFKDVDYFSASDLATALVADWEEAKRDLYRGGVSGSLIVNAFARFNQSLAKKIGDVIEGREMPQSATNYDLGLAQTIHLMLEGGPIYWKGACYTTPTEISVAIRDSASVVPDIGTMLQSGYLSWKMSSLPDVSEATVKVVKKLESIAGQNPELAAYTAMYHFSAERTVSYQKATTPDALFHLLTLSSEKFHARSDKYMSDMELLGFLAYLGYSDNVLSFLSSSNKKDSAGSRIERFYRLLEAACENKAAVREHYSRYSPKAYLHWWQQNLRLYTFSGSAAADVEKRIKSVRISSSMTIDEIAHAFVTLGEYLRDFNKYFCDNIVLARLGISTVTELSEITCNNSDGYFMEPFYGTDVPAGFMRYIRSK